MHPRLLEKDSDTLGGWVIPMHWLVEHHSQHIVVQTLYVPVMCKSDGEPHVVTSSTQWCDARLNTPDGLGLFESPERILVAPQVRYALVS